MSRASKKQRSNQVRASDDEVSRQPSHPRYPHQDRARMALAPGILAAIVLLAGLALVGTDGYDFVLYAVAILTAVMSWFAFQARAFWWLVGLIPMVVIWNPILPLPLPDLVWSSLHLAGVGVVIAAGLIIRVSVKL